MFVACRHNVPGNGLGGGPYACTAMHTQSAVHGMTYTGAPCMLPAITRTVATVSFAAGALDPQPCM